MPSVRLNRSIWRTGGQQWSAAFATPQGPLLRLTFCPRASPEYSAMVPLCQCYSSISAARTPRDHLPASTIRASSAEYATTYSHRGINMRKRYCFMISQMQERSTTTTAQGKSRPGGGSHALITDCSSCSFYRYCGAPPFHRISFTSMYRSVHSKQSCEP